MARGAAGQQFSYFPLGGGLDLITPAIAQKPGSAIAAINYEPSLNGYRRVEGYERFDGRQSPTDAQYWQLNFTAGTIIITKGTTLVGATSGATGVALADAVLTSGTWGSGDGVGYVGVGAITGTFLNGELLNANPAALALEDGTDFTLEDGVTTLDLEGTGGAARVSGTQQFLTSPDDTTARVWQAQATENARALIQKVPGEGNVLGVWALNGTIYAFRNAVGGSRSGDVEKLIVGWAAVPLGYTLDFTSGGTTSNQRGRRHHRRDLGPDRDRPPHGHPIRLVERRDGGGLYRHRVRVGRVHRWRDVNVGASLNLATLTADKVAITLPAGGRYEFVNHNFYGATATKRMYGCNGVGRAFEFDGATFAPIRSGMADDRPHRIAEHKEHLWLGFPGGAFQNSSIGQPLDWSAVTGAAAYGMGDEITDFISNNAGVLTVLAANKVASVYGSSAADFQVVTLSSESGALAHTADRMGEPIYMDHRGSARCRRRRRMVTSTSARSAPRCSRSCRTTSAPRSFRSPRCGSARRTTTA
jgi:hypothetical protein